MMSPTDRANLALQLLEANGGNHHLLELIRLAGATQHQVAAMLQLADGGGSAKVAELAELVGQLLFAAEIVAVLAATRDTDGGDPAGDAFNKAARLAKARLAQAAAMAPRPAPAPVEVTVDRTCPDCGGRGTVYRGHRTCPTCQGKGRR